MNNTSALNTVTTYDLEISGFRLTATGLVPVGEPTYDQWYTCGEFLRRAEKAVGFWIGDWLIYGRGKWGEMYSQAMGDTGLAEQTLKNYRYVAENVKLSSRRDNLSFKHHSAVASLSEWEQNELLGLAEQHEWNAEELQMQVKQYKMEQHRAALPKFDGKIENLGRLTIINADACDLSNLVSKAQLIFTSPPYNVGIEYGEHDDNLSPEEYESMLRQIFCACYESLEVGGRIGVVVPFGVDRNPYVPLVPMMLRLLDDAGFTLRGQIVWDKATTGNRTTWGSWMSASSPALRDRTECVIVAHKLDPQLEIKGAALITDPERFTALAQDLWQIPAESAQRVKHPAPFPIELAERFISFYGYAGCKVVDPFMGSGSTLIAALRLGCEAVGVDIDPTYCALARERIKEELENDRQGTPI